MGSGQGKKKRKKKHFTFFGIFNAAEMFFVQRGKSNNEDRKALQLLRTIVWLSPTVTGSIKGSVSQFNRGLVRLFVSIVRIYGQTWSF